MTKLVPECVRTSDPVIRSPARYRWTTVPAFMQMEVPFLGHIDGQSGLACETVKISVVRAWHDPGSVKQVRQFVSFVGYYRRFIQNFAELSEPRVALTRKGAVFAWTPERQEAFMKLKSCLLQAPILGFSTEDNRFVLDTDASLFAVGGVLNQLHREVVIAYASHCLWLSQRRYCTTRREMLATVTMCNHTCMLASSRLHFNIDRELNTLMQMAFLVNVVNVYDWTVRCHRRIFVLMRPDQRRNWRTNLLPLQKWEIP